MNSDIQNQIFKDRTLRQRITSESHQWFFSTYFSDYLKYPTADFHRQLFAITESEESPLSVVCAFRGSAKSTIMTMSYPIWAVVGKPQKKFVLIASQTQYQARVHLMNIKRELESNELLANDMGPFVEQREEWGSTSLYIPKYNARITAISTEQSVRGIRHGSYRPDLIIADDVEDVGSVKTRDGRNKTFDWYTSEIIPIGDVNTKRIVVGNLLHEDSLIMRLKERIETGEIDGRYYEWAILVKGKSMWRGKYPDFQSIKQLKQTVGNRIAWEREYMLNIVADEDQVIDQKWIQFYDHLPNMEYYGIEPANRFARSLISVDLAISQRDTADYTAMVVVHQYGEMPNERKYYVDFRVVNERLTHAMTLATIQKLYSEMPRNGHYDRLVLVEKVQYQQAVVETLENMRINVLGVQPFGDKRARLQLASSLFEQGRVFFPKDKAIEPVVQQLVHFGVEKHDDLADAMTMALNYAETLPPPEYWKLGDLIDPPKHW